MIEMFYIAYSKLLHKMLYVYNLFSYYIQLSDLAGSLPQRGRPRVNRYVSLCLGNYFLAYISHNYQKRETNPSEKKLFLTRKYSPNIS